MTEQEKEKKDVDSNRKKKLFECFAVAAAALLLILAGYELIRIFEPNTTYTDLGAYLGLTSTDEYDLRIDDERVGRARKIEDEIYIPLETAASKVSSRFYYDGTEKGLIVVTPEGTVRAEEGSRALKILGSDRYISISFMEDNYPCSILRNEEGRTVWIRTDFETEKSTAGAKTHNGHPHQCGSAAGFMAAVFAHRPGDPTGQQGAGLLQAGAGRKGRQALSHFQIPYHGTGCGPERSGDHRRR